MDTDGDGDVRHRLDQAMNRRRLELRMRWNQVADQAGMTYGNLHRIRTGQIAITEFAAQGLERALRLDRGAVDDFVAGRTDALIEQSNAPDLRSDPDYVKWMDGYRNLLAKGYTRDQALAELTDADQQEVQDADRSEHRRDAG